MNLDVEVELPIRCEPDKKISSKRGGSTGCSPRSGFCGKCDPPGQNPVCHFEFFRVTLSISR